MAELGKRRAGGPARFSATIPGQKLAEPTFRGVSDLGPGTAPCAPRPPGPLRPRFPLGDHPAPADRSGAWGALAQTPRKRLLGARFALFGCILFFFKCLL